MIGAILFISYFVIFMVTMILMTIWGDHVEPHLFVALTFPFEFYQAAQNRLRKSRQNSTAYVLKMKQKYYNVSSKLELYENL